MDRYEIRRQNLLRLKKERFNERNVDLARAIDREASYVSRMLYPDGKAGRKRISEVMIGIIEEALGLPKGYLDNPSNLDGICSAPTNLFKEPSETKLLANMQVWDSNTPLGEDEVAIRFLSKADLSAGDCCVCESKLDSRVSLRFAKSTLHQYNISPEDAVCVPVRGDSMEPVLPDNSTVGINCGEKALVDGKIYAISHNGELYIKKLYRLPGGGIRVYSFNEAEYPAREYDASQIVQQSITIVGKVFWYSVLV